jgi:two-component system catabolic regulation response regulator CreB
MSSIARYFTAASKIKAMSTSNPHILLLEDDPAIAQTVVFALERAGFRVCHCLLVQHAQRAWQAGQTAQTEKAEGGFLAAILDIGLPDGSGLEVCKALRSHALYATLPILILSAQSDEIDRVLGLELGADDYLAKPFSPRELVARLKALLRRSAYSAYSAVKSEPASAGLEIDREGQSARLAGVALDLTRLEFLLLCALHDFSGRTRSRESLLRAVWGAAFEGSERTLDTHIKTLRNKLLMASPNSGASISTQRGMGYALNLAR